MGQGSCICLHQDKQDFAPPHEQLSFDAQVPELLLDGRFTGCDAFPHSEHKDDVQTTGRSCGSGGCKLRRVLTRQAAGHGDSAILKDVDGTFGSNGVPLYIMKAFDAKEAANYRRLQELNDPMMRWTARYMGEVTSVDQLGVAKRYMRLANLLAAFDRGPHVMDCKIGFRSFTEGEAAKTVLRPDLYQRMIDLDPDEPTEEEHKAQACTKHRWMMFNDRYTCLSDLGFRIDGIAHSGPGGQAPKKELREARTTEQIVATIVKHFLPTCRDGANSGDDAGTRHARRCVAELILQELQQLQASMAVSAWVKAHEFVGCSLLFVADAHGPAAGVFLIDLAKLEQVPLDLSIDHRSAWKPGNHEDGVFVGVANLVRCWKEVLKLLPSG